MLRSGSNNMPTRRRPKQDGAVGSQPSRACPHCGKAFSSAGGLAYHVKQNVCRKATTNGPGGDKAVGENGKAKNSEKQETVAAKSSRGKRKRSSVESDADDHKKEPAETPVSGRRRKTKVKSYAEDVDEDSSSAYEDKGDSDHDEDDDLEVDDLAPDEVYSEPKKKKTSWRRSKPKITAAPDKRGASFRVLRPGEKFMTKFGIVKVLADNRLPPGKEVSEEYPPKPVLVRYHADCRRFEARQDRMRDEIAAGGRYRRSELKRLHEGSMNESEKAKLSWKLYCSSLDLDEILKQRKTYVEPITNCVKDDCRPTDPWPKDEFYPDRIVECEVIQDKRVIIDVSGVEMDDGGGDRGVVCEERAQKISSRQKVPMRLYLQRKELSEAYREDEANFICADCGKQYVSRQASTYHVKKKICVVPACDIARPKEERIAGIDKRAQSKSARSLTALLLKKHFVSKAKFPVKEEVIEIDDADAASKPASKAKSRSAKSRSSKANSQDLVFGNPNNIKQSKLASMPSWIVFNAERSPMYPEIYNALGFRRGAQNRNHFSKKMMEDGYVPRIEKNRLRKKLKKMVAMDPANFKMQDLTHMGYIPTEALHKKTQESFKKAELNAAIARGKVPPPSEALTSPDPVDADIDHGTTMPPLPSIEAVPVEPPPLPDPADGIPPLPDPIDIRSSQEDYSSVRQRNGRHATQTDDLGMNSGEFTGAEHYLFLEGMRQHGKKWAKIAEIMKTRTGDQIRHHARWYFRGLEKKKNGDLPRAHDETVDEIDFGSSGGDDFFDPEALQLDVDAPSAQPLTNDKPVESREIAIKAPKPKKKRKQTSAKDPGGSDNGSKRARALTTTRVPKLKNKPIVIDTQVLAAECEAGRYPSVSLFNGRHEGKCVLCPKEEEGSLIVNCAFCKNTVHQVCLNKRMLLREPPVVIRENEPLHDTPMCHECITVCLNRRLRAEGRRLSQWQVELSKAGLSEGKIPPASSISDEINLKGNKNADPLEEKDDEPATTAEVCPMGGPGGLICCDYCTAAYSRVLSNTAKEMEIQSVARTGQEVKEILELLGDARNRLQDFSDVTYLNNQRRALLDSDQGASHRKPGSR